MKIRRPTGEPRDPNVLGRRPVGEAAAALSPQTQGMIERFHQTLKRWLGRRPPARTLAELQAQLDAFRREYNECRPHRALGRITPAEAYAATPKAHPAGRGAPGHFRLRYDSADKKGAITLRRAGRLHHLKIGAAHARARVLAIVDEQEVTVVSLDTGEILSTHRIETRQGLLAQHATRPRPLAGVSSD